MERRLSAGSIWHGILPRFRWVSRLLPGGPLGHAPPGNSGPPPLRPPSAVTSCRCGTAAPGKPLWPTRANGKPRPAHREPSWRRGKERRLRGTRVAGPAPCNVNNPRIRRYRARPADQQRTVKERPTFHSGTRQAPFWRRGQDRHCRSARAIPIPVFSTPNSAAFHCDKVRLLREAGTTTPRSTDDDPWKRPGLLVASLALLLNHVGSRGVRRAGGSTGAPARGVFGPCGPVKGCLRALRALAGRASGSATRPKPPWAQPAPQGLPPRGNRRRVSRRVNAFPSDRRRQPPQASGSAPPDRRYATLLRVASVTSVTCDDFE